MATVSSHTHTSTPPLTPPNPNHANGRTTPAKPPTMTPANMNKKSKGKKQADPTETSKLLAAKISQLEQDAAGEKDQEAEIGT